MKFKNKTTGNILESKNEKAIALLKENDQYEVVNVVRKQKADTEKDDKD